MTYTHPTYTPDDGRDPGSARRAPGPRPHLLRRGLPPLRLPRGRAVVGPARGRHASGSGGPREPRGPLVYVGTVRHRRHRPRPNAFRYRVWHLLLDVDEVPRSTASAGSARATRPVALPGHDHLGGGGPAAARQARRWVAGQGGRCRRAACCCSPTRGCSGHVFNPVSWWFCRDPDGRLRLVVAEVRNTFGDWHAYLLDDLEVDGTARCGPRPEGVPRLAVPADRRTHYRFAIRAPPAGDLVTGWSRGWRSTTTTASSSTPPRPGRRNRHGRSLWRALVRYPLVTLRTST
jgi:uncharacterized protein